MSLLAERMTSHTDFDLTSYECQMRGIVPARNILSAVTLTLYKVTYYLWLKVFRLCSVAYLTRLKIEGEHIPVLNYIFTI
jgi:hypothetical protein